MRVCAYVLCTWSSYHGIGLCYTKKGNFYTFVYLLKDSGLILDFSGEKAYGSYSILSSVAVDGGPSKEMIVRLTHNDRGYAWHICNTVPLRRLMPNVWVVISPYWYLWYQNIQTPSHGNSRQSYFCNACPISVASIICRWHLVVRFVCTSTSIHTHF